MDAFLLGHAVVMGNFDSLMITIRLPQYSSI